MKLIYIAGPFRASSAYVPGHQDMFAVQQNVMEAMRIGLDVARTGAAFPIIPHANTMFFTGAAADAVWLEGDLEVMRRCDAVLLTSDWRRSSGARAEVDEAKRIGLPIFEDMPELAAWLSV